LSVIKTTKKSLDICVYAITLNQIINECIKLHKNNVIIRIITNGNNETYGYRLRNGNNDQIIHKKKLKSLQRVGIEIRLVSLRHGYMHNKFAIIDSHLLINGSLNWTKNAIFNNFEDVIITSERQLVSVYLNKFNEFWDSLSHN
jgi:phosphatidylserine/phosphatidylglycerophosphate/cardiolipin synthase-like enzyme